MSLAPAIFQDRSPTAVLNTTAVGTTFENKLPTIVFKVTTAPSSGGFPYILPYILS